MFLRILTRKTFKHTFTKSKRYFYFTTNLKMSATANPSILPNFMLTKDEIKSTVEKICEATRKVHDEVAAEAQPTFANTFQKLEKIDASLAADAAA